MSAENMEIVRCGLEAALRKPKPEYGTMNELYAPDHEFVSLLAPIETRSRGVSGWREWQADMDDTVDWEATLVELLDLDRERVLAVLALRLRGRGSGVDLGEQRVASVLTLQDGKIIRTENYRSRTDALKAVSMEE